MNRTLAARYAEACYQAAREADAGDVVEQDMALLREVCSDGEAPFEHLTSPDIPPEARVRAVERAFGEAVHPLTLNLLKLCALRGRLSLLAAIPDAFHDIIERNSRTVHAAVTSARDIPHDLQTRFRTSLEARIGRPVDTEFTTDPGLGAGFRVVYGDTMIDTSTRAALARMRHEMATGSVRIGAGSMPEDTER